VTKRVEKSAMAAKNKAPPFVDGMYFAAQCDESGMWRGRGRTKD